MDDEQKKDLIYRPLITGGAASIASLSVVGFDDEYMGVPAPIVMGAAGGLASFASAMSNEYVYENVLSDSESELVYNLTAPSITGIGLVGVNYLMFGSDMSLKHMGISFGIGVGSELVGSFASDKILAPAVDLA